MTAEEEQHEVSDKENEDVPETNEEPEETVNTNKENNEDEGMFLDPIEDEFRCDSCRKFLYNPFTMKSCKHTLCSACYSKGIKSKMKCPIDQEVIEKGLPQNKRVLKKIAKLKIKCPHHKKSCEWTGILLELTDHSLECLYHEIPCKNGCGIEFERQYEKGHLEDDCKKRSIHCKLCEEEIIAQDEEEHIKEVCTKFMIACPNSCSVGEVARADFDHHLQEECEKQEKPCPYSTHGCEEMGLKDKIDAHVKQASETHVNMMNKTVVEMHRLLTLQTAELVDTKAKLMKMENNLYDVVKSSGCAFIWRINSYMDKFTQAKTGKRFTFFSEPFYSHQLGYRMGASICPNGDGKMSGKYFSVFVCIYKGENDSLLPWPFASNIKITMIDQNLDISKRKSIEYTLRPNVIEENDMFLKRPKGERNPSFGALRFCALDEIEKGHFIVDDVMYLKISVDGEKIPLF